MQLFLIQEIEMIPFNHRWNKIALLTVIIYDHIFFHIPDQASQLISHHCSEVFVLSLSTIVYFLVYAHS